MQRNAYVDTLTLTASLRAWQKGKAAMICTLYVVEEKLWGSGVGIRSAKGAEEAACVDTVMLTATLRAWQERCSVPTG